MTVITKAHKEVGIHRAPCRVATAAREAMAREVVLIMMSTAQAAQPDMAPKAVIMAKVVTDQDLALAIEARIETVVATEIATPAEA